MKKLQKLYILFFLVFLINTNYYLQSNSKHVNQDSIKIAEIFTTANTLKYKLPDSVYTLINQGFDLCNTHNVEYYKPMFHEVRADVHWHLSKLDSSIIEYSKAEELYRSKGSILMVGHNLADIGYVYMDKHDYQKAMEYYSEALIIAQENNDGDLNIIATTYIGQIYHLRSEYEKALETYLNALSYFLKKEKNYDRNVAIMYNNVAGVYLKLEEIDSSKVYFKKGLDLSVQINDLKNIANSSLNLAELALRESNYSDAEKYYLEAISTYEELNSNFHLLDCYLNLAELYFVKAEYNKAKIYYLKTLVLATKTGNISKISLANKGLAKYFEFKKNYEKSLSYYKEFMMLNDSLQKIESTEQLNELLTKYETEQKELEIVNLEKEKAVQQAQIADEHSKLVKQEAKAKQERLFRYSLIVGLFFMLLIAGYVWYAYKQKSKANLIISEQKSVLEEQKKQVELQKEEIEEAHKEIKDSINYAKRIQTAILPPLLNIKNELKDSFVLYLPKDIVAGDFYWLEPIGNEILLAAADCTGHGVPGAMVSVICNNALNRSVREFGLKEPGKILDKTRDFVQQEFSKSEEDVHDGMDIALIKLSAKNSKHKEFSELQYAGANNPLWVVRNHKIIELPADRQPVGKYDNSTPYTTLNFNLEKGDTIYIFSDGYQDQFGGEKGKKFKSTNFKKLLVEINDLPMNEQMKTLQNRYTEWRGDIEQIDDVCVIGVRV